MSPRPLRVLRIIARLNVGGTAVHVTVLTANADRTQFESRLVTGTENPGEGTMIDFTRAHGIEPTVVPEMVGQANFGPRDVVAIWKLYRLMRQWRPDVVDTHTAKAGFVGRVAAWLARVPVVIHTYHGHVLHGYYSPAKTRALRTMERWLARMTTRIIAVSEEVRDDLVKYGVAPPQKIAIIPLGLDLEPFAASQRHRGELKRELGLGPDTPLAGIVGRIFAIKNHALFVDAAAEVLRTVPAARFVIVGDGILRPEVEARASALGIADRIIVTGWRTDLPRIYADLDVLVVSSDNEGTPFSIIEAMASGVPVVATRVGGVPSLVEDGVTGFLVPPRDAAALAAGIARLLTQPTLAAALAAASRTAALARFGADRMIAETTALYRALSAR